jgi:hypothetical protein
VAVSFIGGGNRKKTTDLAQVTAKLYQLVETEEVIQELTTQRHWQH